MIKKYEFTDETIEHASRTLRRIRRLSGGTLGGWIEEESNLSHDGDCWVWGNAKVYGSAEVYGNAKVGGSSEVYGHAKVYGGALVWGNAEVGGSAEVFGSAEVGGSAEVCDGYKRS